MTEYNSRTPELFRLIASLRFRAPPSFLSRGAALNEILCAASPVVALFLIDDLFIYLYIENERGQKKKKDPCNLMQLKWHRCVKAAVKLIEVNRENKPSISKLHFVSCNGLALFFFPPPTDSSIFIC